MEQELDIKNGFVSIPIDRFKQFEDIEIAMSKIGYNDNGILVSNCGYWGSRVTIKTLSKDETIAEMKFLNDEKDKKIQSLNMIKTTFEQVERHWLYKLFIKPKK
jgi:hypothetical protein